MAQANQSGRDVHRVRSRIEEINQELSDESEFREFGATDDIHYRMTDARCEALRLERERLQEILGDL